MEVASRADGSTALGVKVGIFLALRSEDELEIYPALHVLHLFAGGDAAFLGPEIGNLLLERSITSFVTTASHSKHAFPRVIREPLSSLIGALEAFWGAFQVPLVIHSFFSDPHFILCTSWTRCFHDRIVFEYVD